MAKSPKSRKDCIDDLVKRSGRKRSDVEDELDQILNRAEDYESDGMPKWEAYARARDERLAETAEIMARSRTNRINDLRIDVDRARYYKDTIAEIKALPAGWLKAGLIVKAARLALEAKLVGVNIPFWKSRNSVDAQYAELRKQWIGGLVRDLDQAKLAKVFFSGHLESKWIDELFQLNRENGNPGVTGDKQALEIAQTIKKWQRTSMDMLNLHGAWVRSYQGYITRQSHSADLIRAAGQDQWVSHIMSDPDFDIRRTFGTADKQRARDALSLMWHSFAAGNHFDYGKLVDEPMFPNTARQASDSREIHWTTGAGWRRYNEKYGVSNPTDSIVRALDVAARRTALMKEFGTRPAEAFESDLNYIRDMLKKDTERGITQLNKLRDEQEASPTDERAKEIADLDSTIKEQTGQFIHFDNWEQKFRNRFAQIDGSAQRPVNRALSETVSNIMAVQRTAKLGGIISTHWASLPTKPMEAAHWGIPFAERWGRVFTDFTRGLEGSAKREALNMGLVHYEHMAGQLMMRYDVSDAPAGALSRIEALFWKFNPVKYVLDNQRGGSERMFASYLGGKRGTAWEDIGPKEQRILRLFGMGQAEWKALHGVDWTNLSDGRTYLFPQDAKKLSDEQITDYLKEAKPTLVVTAKEIAKTRENLALQIGTAYSDRAGYSIPMPSARIRAMMFQKNYEPGTPLNAVLRLVYQFKIWPADMMVRAWEREIYGRIGDGQMDRVAGIVETAVAAVIFGVTGNMLSDTLKGRDPIEKLRKHPIESIAEGARRSGMGSLVGDFLFGQFDRHGLTLADTVLGPTFGQMNTIADIYHAGDRAKEGMFSESANRQRIADLLQTAKTNTPFMNYWATQLATDALIWHRLQEWINPGYLQRHEQRLQQQQGTKFWLSPAKTDNWVTGKGYR